MKVKRYIISGSTAKGEEGNLLCTKNKKKSETCFVGKV